MLEYIKVFKHISFHFLSDDFEYCVLYCVTLSHADVDASKINNLKEVNDYISELLECQECSNVLRAIAATFFCNHAAKDNIVKASPDSVRQSSPLHMILPQSIIRDYNLLLLTSCSNRYFSFCFR